MPYVDLNRSANLIHARETFYDVLITTQTSLINSTPHEDLPKPVEQIEKRQDHLIRILKDMLNRQQGESTRN